MKPFIIAIAGGTGSGKTTLADDLAKELHATIISTDNYYKDRSNIEKNLRDDLNYDHPDSIEWTLLEKHIKALSNGRSISMPQYEFGTHIRKKEKITLTPRDYIIVEGILALHDKKFNRLYDYKVFVDMPEAIRLTRRLDRDIRERHATEELTMRMWNSNVKPMHDKYVEPSKYYADIIVDNDAKCIKLIKQNVRTIIHERQYKS